MLAFYRSGRQAAALSVYGRVREIWWRSSVSNRVVS
ncbi:BTAD domain-containing putative transcriptional regulator [Actinomadura hallensis]